MGAAQDLVVQAFAENGFVSAPTFTMLLIHQDPKSGYDYILVDMPPNPLAGDVFTANTRSVNCFLIDSSFFLKTDDKGRHFIMIRSVRDRPYGRSKISIEAYLLAPLEGLPTQPSQSLYHFIRMASVSTVSDACTARELSRLEQKLLNAQFKK
jgi:hypothetical protein